jgi:hypothetical protein
MRIAAALSLAVGIAAALSQHSQGRRASGPADGGSPRSKRDAGQKPILLGTDPPGRLRPWPDAGPVAQVDAGVPAVERELSALRLRVDALERERAQLQQQSQQLSQVVQELQDLRAQLAQGEQRKEADAQQQAARRDALQAGISSLQQAQYALAGGDSAVDDQLAQAQGSFPPQAQKDIEAARTALRNRDLSQARAYLSAAIADAQQGR